MNDKLKELSRNKAILSFEDVHGVSVAQLKEAQREEAVKNQDAKEHGNWKRQ